MPITRLSNAQSFSGADKKANDVIDLNSQTISKDYIVPSGYNAVSAGPVIIADGVTVTIPSGCEWSIV